MVLISFIKKAFRCSLGMLIQCTALAILIVDKAALNGKCNLFSLLAWQSFNLVCCLASPVKELNLESAPVIVQYACRIHLNICAEIEFVTRFPFIIAGLLVDCPNVSSKRY